MRSHLRGSGIEIGALHRPLPLGPHASVSYVDRLPVEQLRAHYPELAAEALAPVSVLATAEDLSPVASGSQDFVIANHLLEHCENALKALMEFQRVLKPGGVLYLVLPDKSVTFDRERAVTTTEHLIDEYRTGSEKNRFAHYLEWARLVDHKDEAHARGMMAMGYSIHFHVWTRAAFVQFLTAARAAANFTLTVIDEDVGDDEFIFILKKAPTLWDRAVKRLPVSNRVPALMRELWTRLPLG